MNWVEFSLIGFGLIGFNRSKQNQNIFDNM